MPRIFCEENDCFHNVPALGGCSEDNVHMGYTIDNAGRHIVKCLCFRYPGGFKSPREVELENDIAELRIRIAECRKNRGVIEAMLEKLGMGDIVE